jgi:hypothetical protein
MPKGHEGIEFRWEGDLRVTFCGPSHRHRLLRDHSRRCRVPLPSLLLRLLARDPYLAHDHGPVRGPCPVRPALDPDLAFARPAAPHFPTGNYLRHHPYPRAVRDPTDRIRTDTGPGPKVHQPPQLFERRLASRNHAALHPVPSPSQ